MLQWSRFLFILAVILKSTHSWLCPFCLLFQQYRFHPLQSTHLPSSSTFSSSLARPSTSSSSMSSPATKTSSSSDNADAKGGKTLPCVCAVCGDGASEHLHYGAICCFSCRAFFRRYADRKKCVCVRGDSNCVIDTNRRNDCMHCRLQKCYKIGMKKVRSELDCIYREIKGFTWKKGALFIRQSRHSFISQYIFPFLLPTSLISLLVWKN